MILSPSRGLGGAGRHDGQLVERLPGLGIYRRLAGQRLPAANRGIDVVRIELDGAAHAAGLLRRQQRRPLPTKGSSTTARRVEQSFSASITSGNGFTVGWVRNSSMRPRLKVLTPA